MAYITFQPKDYFNTKLYTGNGSTNAITGVGFQPDWVWIKNASSGSNYDHVLYDAVRGVTKHIHSNTTDAEDTQSDGLTAFGTDGFTVGADTKSNSNGSTLVSWNWKAGGGAGSSNTDGTINTISTSVNTTAGISISTYTGNATLGATVGHGLGVAPKAIIVKSYTNSEQWVVGHNEMNSTNAWDYYMNLNSTAERGQNNNRFGNVYPTSSVFTLGNEDQVNSSSKSYVAYCFAEKKGFSKFGTYKGNGSSDGVFVYTGFKPAFLIVKRSSDVEDWKMFDNKRPGYNLTNLRLKPNGNESEASSGGFDFTSNGFKARSTDAAENASGSTYIYMAFAEEPLVSSNNIPATAR
jgi:hypothetical protein